MDDRDVERFSLSYVFIDECWIWIRSKVTGGYGSIVINGKTKRAHRVSYELAYGVKLTPDQFLHHVCRNKDCVNPEHLEIVSQLTHTDSATYGNKDKTHCPYGHEYTPANTHWNKGGRSRECYQCKLHRQQRQYLRKKQYIAERLKSLALKYKAEPEQPL
jgi:hypothetical protein